MSEEQEVAQEVNQDAAPEQEMPVNVIQEKLDMVNAALVGLIEASRAEGFDHGVASTIKAVEEKEASESVEPVEKTYTQDDLDAAVESSRAEFIIELESMTAAVNADNEQLDALKAKYAPKETAEQTVSTQP